MVGAILVLLVGGESMSAGMVIPVGRGVSIHPGRNGAKDELSSGVAAFETGADCVVAKTGKSGTVGASNVGARGGCWKSISGGEFDLEFGAVAEICRPGVCHRPAELGVEACPAADDEKKVGTESILCVRKKLLCG